MAQFNYQARDAQGRKLNGRVEAKNKATAAAILRQKGLLIVNVTERGESLFTEVTAALAKVKQDDIVNFTRQLATMINAGLPLLKGFAILESQARPAMKKVLRHLVRDIEGGQNFGAALENQKETFSPVYMALIQAGEAAGALDTILLRLADTMEKQKEFRAKTKGALIYPVIVLTAMLAVAVVMMIFVVPQMTSLYADFDEDLPLATQILMNVSDFFVERWYVMLAGVIGAGFAFTRWIKTKQGRQQFDKLMLKLPIFGPLRQQVLSTEFARTMALMVGAGISLLESLEIVSRGMDNVIYRDALDKTRKDVEKGKPLSKSLSHYEVFPDLVSQMISVGEETGQLDDVLNKLANYYEAESEHTVKNLTTALEPLIMIVLGIGVGFLIIAIIMPIYGLTSKF